MPIRVPYDEPVREYRPPLSFCFAAIYIHYTIQYSIAMKTSLQPAKRLPKSGWIELGFLILKEAGAHLLTVEYLCARAERSKGSFYFHFGSIDDFCMQLVSLWADRFGSNVTDHLQLRAARNEPLSLNDLAARLDPSLERGIRSLADQLPQAAEKIADVDRQRLDLLRTGLTAQFNDKDAEALATVEYAAYIGLLNLEHAVNPEHSQKLYARFLPITGRY